MGFREFKDILENVELNYVGAVYTALVLSILTIGLNLPGLDLSHRPDAARAVRDISKYIIYRWVDRDSVTSVTIS